MKESVIYQDILQIGRQEGLIEGEKRGKQEGIAEGRRLERYAMLRQIVKLLQERSIPVDWLLGIFGVSLAELEADGEES